jgi:hypothetical protein
MIPLSRDYFYFTQQGYVDDPRNTDHAWAESEAVHIHDENDFLAGFPLLEPDRGEQHGKCSSGVCVSEREAKAVQWEMSV